MSMFNECHIHSCDCTCLNVFSHAQSLLINQKIFLSVLVVFGKYFVFTKIVKNFENLLPCSGDSVAGRTSRMPQSRVHTEISHNLLATHWRVNALVVKKT